MGIFLLLGKVDVKGLTGWLIALAAGTMLGNTFFHLLPEAAVEFDGTGYLPVTLFSFIGFFILEKLIHWRHCHDGVCETHSGFGIINLIGDGVHNFVDGVVIAGAFAVDVQLGLMTAFAIALHEIPQELGDFGVLLHSGFSRSQALLANFGSGLTALLGGIVGFYLTENLEAVTMYFVPIAAGSFLYISMSDLIPELRNTIELRKSLASIGIFLLGVGMMWVFSTSEFFEVHDHGDHDDVHIEVGELHE